MGLTVHEKREKDYLLSIIAKPSLVWSKPPDEALSRLNELTAKELGYANNIDKKPDQRPVDQDLP